MEMLAHSAIMSQCSVALLLRIVDLLCVGSSVTHVCVRTNYFARILRFIYIQVAHSLVWLSLVDLSGS